MHDPTEDLGLVVAAEEPEPALAQAQHGVELAVVRPASGRPVLSNSRGQAIGCGGGARQGDEVRRQVDADDVEPAPGQCERVAPGPAADVEDTMSRLEPERPDEVLDLLLGPLREGVAAGPSPRNSATGLNQSRGGGPAI